MLVYLANRATTEGAERMAYHEVLRLIDPEHESLLLELPEGGAQAE